MTIATLPANMTLGTLMTASPVNRFVSARPTFPLGGSTVFCHGGDSLQSKINSLTLGDTLVVDANTDFGAVTLPARADGGWIAIVSSGTLPAIGTRIAPSDAAQCFRINVTGGGTAVTATDGTQGWYIAGLHCASGASGDSGRNMIMIAGNDPNARHIAGQTEVQRVLFQHLLMDFSDAAHVRRGILANGRDIRLADSYLDGFRQSDAVPGADSQAWASYDTTGVHRIENTLLSATAENLMYGGADATSATYLPADIEIVQATLRKNPRWNYQDAAYNNSHFLLKAGLELKMCQRVRIEGCEFFNSWLWPHVTIDNWNQDGSNPFSTITDVLVRNNWCHTSCPIFAQVFTGLTNPTLGVSRVLFVNNLAQDIKWVGARSDEIADGIGALANKSGMGFRFIAWTGAVVQDIAGIHNTILCDDEWLYLGHQPGDGMTYPRTTMQYNVVGFGKWGVRQENSFPGFLTTPADHNAMLAEVGVATAADQFIKNAMIVRTGAQPADPPYFPPPFHNEAGAWDQAKFLNPDSTPVAASGVNLSGVAGTGAGADGTLAASSPLRGTADAGSDYGVNFAALNAALANAPPPVPAAPVITGSPRAGDLIVTGTGQVGATVQLLRNGVPV